MGSLHSCYCAFCRMPRSVYRKKALSPVNFVQAFGIALFLSYVFWQTLNPKALVIFVMALMVLEIIILVRSRFGLPCPHCGFDPHLYVKNKALACEKVKKHLEDRQNDPNVWLARRPPLRLPRRKSTREIIA